MNYSRLALAALAGIVASFAVGFLIISVVPALMEETHKYPTVFRAKEEMMSFMPFGFFAAAISVVVVAIIFAMTHQRGWAAGLCLGILIGIFAICHVTNNYVNYRVGGKLAVGQAAAYLVQWIVTGIVIGLIYKPLGTP